MILSPSPNHGDRKGRDVSMVVLHYTGMKTAEEALIRMRDPASEVSAHYMIEQDGRTHQLVAEGRRAWHAGVAWWQGEEDVNSISIGIELVNRGHEWGYEDFPDEQLDSLIDLLRVIRERHPIPASRVLGHSDVAPGRKEDPGEKFPWALLAAEGHAIGVWSGMIQDDPPGEEKATRMLRDIGYGVAAFGAVAAVIAFQRRFCPSVLGEGFGPKTRSAIGEVWAKVTQR